MEIALVPIGTRGDVQPMIELAVDLVAAGHRARVCAPPDFCPAVEERGVEARPVGSPIRPYLERVAARLHGSALAFHRESRRFTLASLTDHFRELPDALRGVDRVLAAGPAAAVSSVAEARDIPYRFVAYTPALLPSAEHAPALLPLQSRRPWLNRLLWRGVPALGRATLGRALDAGRAGLGLAPLADPFRHLLGPRPLVTADAPLAPVPDDVEVAFDQVPCLHRALEEPLPDKVEHFLQAGPAPVFIGFGSMTDPQPERTTRILVDALEGLGVRALLSEGWAGLGRALPLPDHVLAVGPLCHARLFPRTRLVVHHGGAGTTTTAARAGVPQILLPHLLDQFYFAERVWRLGVGPRALARKRMGARSLVELLEACLGNEALETSARSLAARLAESRESAPSVVDVVTEPESAP